jgi:putative membrane-bound dehydrogenase-like protein
MPRALSIPAPASWLRYPRRAVTLLALALAAGTCRVAAQDTPPAARVVPPAGFELSLWAREPMLRGPVALSFDEQGRVYVVETARRGSVDIDIRAHPDWLMEDLANQNVDDLRRFFRRRMAPELSRENARWLKDYNGDGSHDWRDLMGVQERVHRLEDTSGSGRADRAKVFAEGFNEEISGVLAGVLAREKDVLVTVYPDLWRLRDLDGDGVADTREILFRGFGVHAGFDGHDLHGLVIGPDGKVYFSIGDNGFSVVNREGRRLHYPNTGGVLRMNPDGTNLEVFATGLRNVQEIAFDTYGNWFAVDNDGDLADERERFVQIAEGSDSGWRIHWQFHDAGWRRFTGAPDYNPWIDERMWVPQFPGQPAHITPPITNYSVGPSGFKFNPGTALNAAYRDHFFLVQFPVQKITAFRAEPRGATFRMAGEHVFLSGMMASSLQFSPDGSMFIADWDGMWNPSGRGALWKLDDPKSATLPIRAEVKELIAASFRERTPAELRTWMGHADQRIRLKAQFEWARRGDLEGLLETANRSDLPQLVRIHALWGVGQVNRPVDPDRLPFHDGDPELRAQAAKIAGDLHLKTAAPQLAALLRDPSPRIRMLTGIALGKAGGPAQLDALVQAVIENREDEAFLRHGLVLGLAGAAPADRLAELATHAEPRVRIAAVLALRRQRAADVIRFLKDADPLVRIEAVRAIHDDDFVPTCLSQVAALADHPEPGESEAISRRALSANLRLGRDQDAQRLLRAALDPKRPERMRIEALECLADWNKSPFVDRVEGLTRTLLPATPDLGGRLIAGHLQDWIQSGPALATAALRCVDRLAVPVPTPLLLGWITAGATPAETRTAAVQLLLKRDPSVLASRWKAWLGDSDPHLRAAAWEIAAQADADGFLAEAGGRESRLSTAEHQQVIRLAGGLKHAGASAWLRGLVDQLAAGQLAPELALDTIEAVERHQDASVRDGLKRLPQAAGKNGVDRLRYVLVGGNAAAGREVFRTHVGAQCIRCHDAGGEGKQAGPVLSGIGGRTTRAELLESLLDPSAKLADGFAQTTVYLRDGDTLDGVRVAESTDSVTLRLITGEKRIIARKDIDKLAANPVSPMPPMGDVLSPVQLRDVIEFLATWK